MNSDERIVVALVFCPIIDERRGIYSKRKINKFRKQSIVCIIGVNLIAILSRILLPV